VVTVLHLHAGRIAARQPRRRPTTKNQHKLPEPPTAKLLPPPDPRPVVEQPPTDVGPQLRLDLHMHQNTTAIVDSRAVDRGGIMAQLIVRNLNDDLVRRLKERAASHGRSAEEEHRRILRAALRSSDLADHLAAIPEVGDDSDFERQADLPRDVEL
jgi:plasmid stability protein